MIAQEPVAQFTGLTPAYPAPVLVVDRPRWVEANLKSFEKIIVPFKSNLEASGKLPTGGAKVVGEKMAGAEMGALMSFMARRVLGQFDPFWEGPNGPGRLLLVAPNVVSIERKIEVDPRHQPVGRAVIVAPDHCRGLRRSSSVGGFRVGGGFGGSAGDVHAR